ncbi:Hypothetical predicted protein [Podarcis lilfordi]|uniref:Uncharacterized protein n=1 Tax=Podarcis lilfordi TaxID=74358 RepID=A0AA35LGX5_9SAUR|nr:Hypothetical predicted protein [Podarcis lilfordi]
MNIVAPISFYYKMGTQYAFCICCEWFLVLLKSTLTNVFRRCGCKMLFAIKSHCYMSERLSPQEYEQFSILKQCQPRYKHLANCRIQLFWAQNSHSCYAD